MFLTGALCLDLIIFVEYFAHVCSCIDIVLPKDVYRKGCSVNMSFKRLYK